MAGDGGTNHSTFGDVRGSVYFCRALGPGSGHWWAAGNSWSFRWVQDGVIFIIPPQWCIDLLLLLFLLFLPFLLLLLLGHGGWSSCCKESHSGTGYSGFTANRRWAVNWRQRHWWRGASGERVSCWWDASKTATKRENWTWELITGLLVHLISCCLPAAHMVS